MRCPLTYVPLVLPISRKYTVPFRSVISGDQEAMQAMDEAAVIELILATHGGLTSRAYEEAVMSWLASARHPQTGRAFDSMVYQPMLELLDHLRANDFRVFIVSGGSIGFLRPWSERW